MGCGRSGLGEHERPDVLAIDLPVWRERRSGEVRQRRQEVDR